MKIKIPPPIIALIFAAMMIAVAYLIPQGHFALVFNLQGWLAGMFAGAGLLCMALGLGAFRKSATTINPLRPQDATTLVVDGVYTFTRNPMYLGMLLILAGVSSFLGSLLAVGLLPGFVLYMNLFQIFPEEAALKELFGDDYLKYLKDVRRWA